MTVIMFQKSMGRVCQINAPKIATLCTSNLSGYRIKGELLNLVLPKNVLEVAPNRVKETD